MRKCDFCGEEISEEEAEKCEQIHPTATGKIFYHPLCRGHSEKLKKADQDQPGSSPDNAEIS